MPEVTLGRFCTISANGRLLTTVRKVSVTRSSTEIECPMYGDSQQVKSFPGPQTTTVEVELVGTADAASLASAMDSDDTVQLTASNCSGTFRVFGVTVEEPLDDVVIYTATLKRSH